VPCSGGPKPRAGAVDRPVVTGQKLLERRQQGQQGQQRHYILVSAQFESLYIKELTRHLPPPPPHFLLHQNLHQILHQNHHHHRHPPLEQEQEQEQELELELELGLELGLELEPEQGRQEGWQQGGRGGDETGYQSKYMILLDQEFSGVLYYLQQGRADQTRTLLAAANGGGGGKHSELIELHILCVQQHPRQRRHFVVAVVAVVAVTVDSQKKEIKESTSEEGCMFIYLLIDQFFPIHFTCLFKSF
jgi:hypothetical protein